MDAPAPAAAVPDLQSKQELVDRFARLKTVWLDLASTSVERDELAAVAEELRLLGSRQSTVALCTQRHAAAKAQHEALQRTLSSLRESLANTSLVDAAGKFEALGRAATEQRLKGANDLISPLVERQSARIRAAAPRGPSLNVVAVEKGDSAPAPLLVPLEPAAKPVHESSEEDFDASILTLQAMFSVPRRVAARALARARLRLPVAIEILLDNAQKDALIAESGLVVPAPAPEAKPPAATRRPTPPAVDNLMSFEPNVSPPVKPPHIPIAAAAPSIFDLPNLSPRSEALRIEEAVRKEKEQEAKAAEYYKMMKEEQANEALARKLAEEELASRKYPCTICGDSFALDDMYVLDECSHRFCRDCLKGYLLSKINDGRTRDIRCPEIKCAHLVSYSEVRHLVDAATFEKFEKFLLQATLNDDPNTKWCPRPGCGNAVIAHQRGGGNMLICNNPTCKFAFCLQCLEPWHADSTCEQYKQWKLENSEAEKRFASWAQANTKQCPSCKANIEKDGGCNHMTCGKCQHEFCWLCMADYSDEHFSDGGCEQYT